MTKKLKHLLSGLVFFVFVGCDCTGDSGSNGTALGDDNGEVVDEESGSLDSEIDRSEVSDESSQQDDTIYVILLAGQSNMVGLGVVDELTDDLQTPNTEVIIHAEAHLDQSMAGQWLPLSGGFGAEIDRFGPELSFGLDLEQSWPDDQLALIKTSVGGTSLAVEWNTEDGELYLDFLDHTRRALADLEALGEPQVVGLIWMQGETDAIDPDNAEVYQERLTTFIEAVRTEMQVPDLPVIIGLITTIPAWVYHDMVRAAQTAVSEQLDNVEIVETDDLPRHQDDPFHYDTEGCLQLGERFAEAFAPFHP